MGAGDQAYMTELCCRRPYSQWSASLAPAMLLVSVGVWRDESFDPLDARHQGRQLFKETFERDFILGLRLLITDPGEENNNSARAVILCSRFIAVPPWQ